MVEIHDTTYLDMKEILKSKTKLVQAYRYNYKFMEKTKKKKQKTISNNSAEIE